MKYFSGPRITGFFLNCLAAVAPRRAGQLSFYLLGLPRRKKAKRSEKKFLAAARVHFDEIGGRTIAVYRWGDSGPLVLLAHGWESHAGRWRKLAPALVRAGFQVIAVDAPAHGRSEGRHFTMLRFAEALGVLIRRYGPVEAVVGHSVGGAACIWAMSQLEPALQPKRAVIMASFGSMQYVMDNARRLIGASDALMNALDDYVERVTGARIAHYSVARAAEQLGKVEALLVHDRHDRVTHFRQSELLYAAWPGARLLATEGFGHGLTAPPVLEAVLAFVREKSVC